MQTRPMVLRKALVTPDGTVVVQIGTGGKALPHAEPGRMIFRTKVDGAPRSFAVPEDALEPAPEAKRMKRRDDIVLPDPEPLAVTVPPALLDRDPHAWPFALAALATLFVAALMF